MSDDRRWEEIDGEVAAIRDGKVVDGDPSAIESELLREQDELEWEAGEEFFGSRDDGRREEG